MAYHENNQTDYYKSKFKFYKNENYEQIKDSVIDFSNLDSLSNNVIQVEPDNIGPIMPLCKTSHHFKPFSEWKLYTLKNSIDGLLIIPQVIRQEHRADWFQYFHNDLPNDNSLNLKSNIHLNEVYNIDKLRWITFGYHHNWDTKVYSVDQSIRTIPERVVDLCQIVKTFMGFQFVPEAGIVNYYTSKSTLCFHTDHSELNHDAPLISLSLGSSALFLIGGVDKKQDATEIIPILLRDTDLLIMSGNSRLAWHAVPKVYPFYNNGNHCVPKSMITRINVNVRQVL